jgi:hypothetical protein
MAGGPEHPAYQREPPGIIESAPEPNLPADRHAVATSTCLDHLATNRGLVGSSWSGFRRQGERPSDPAISQLVVIAGGRMSLEEELARRRREVANLMRAADQRVVDQTIERNRMLQLAEQSLEVGETLPDFELPDRAGRMMSGNDILDRGPLVLAFFRCHSPGARSGASFDRGRRSHARRRCTRKPRAARAHRFGARSGLFAPQRY